jgi:hypothetical protein
MKTTASFRLSKYAKRLIALLPSRNEHERGAFKRMMIEAEVAASIRPVVKRERNAS